MADFKINKAVHRQTTTTIKSTSHVSSLNSNRLALLCLFGLFLTTCDGAILPNPLEAKDNIEILDTEILIRNEQSEHEPPVTSSDLPKQIPAPPRPHFASTPHYEQQIARFVWVTPQYNTPYPLAKQV